MIRETFDISNESKQFTIEGIHKNDNGFRTFKFYLDIDGDPFYIPEGCIATLYATLPGGETIFDTCEIADNCVAYTLKGGPEDSISSQPGEAICEIRIISKEGEILTSPKFSFWVEDIMITDEAIESTASFTALTNALNRVLIAENGLDSKIDKVKGSEGNVIVFDKDGTIKDSGSPSGTFYVVPYDSDKGEKVKEIIASIKHNHGKFSLYMEVGSRTIPASIIFARDTVITATLHDYSSVKYEIKLTPSDEITFSQESIYISNVDAMEDTSKAPTGAVVMQYIEDHMKESCEDDINRIVSSEISEHNTAAESHNDIRLLISGLTSRLNALADSTDTDLDQLSEIVAYIKSNKSLIDRITTSKVSVADIIDNLTTNVSNKPLSAAQGVALKAMIDAIVIPKKLSDLSNDSLHRTVTDSEKAVWNAKSNFSGKYADLEGKPIIPAKTSELNNDSGFVKSDSLSLAIASDGLIYLFVNGNPVGTGIPQGVSSDVFGYVDENNTVVLTGNLADGTYSIKYEMADGSVVDIGSMVLGEDPTKPKYTNLIPLSVNADGTPYVGTNGEDGYKVGYRINSSGGETALSETRCTGFMPLKEGYRYIYIKPIEKLSADNAIAIAVYDSNKTKIFYSTFHPEGYAWVTEQGDMWILDTHAATTSAKSGSYFRISCGITSETVITVDEPIE